MTYGHSEQVCPLSTSTHSEQVCPTAPRLPFDAAASLSLTVYTPAAPTVLRAIGQVRSLRSPRCARLSSGALRGGAHQHTQTGRFAPSKHPHR